MAKNESNNNNNNNDDNLSDYFKDRAGTEKARYHVVPHDDEGWAIKREGKDDPESTHKSQSEAIDEAKKAAKENKTMVYIHNDDGQIETQEDYGD